MMDNIPMIAAAAGLVGLVVAFFAVSTSKQSEN